MFECRYCDRKFETKQARGSHEGHSHEQDNEVKCEWCGEMFEKYISQIEKYDTHFCSEDCRIKWFGEKHNGSGKDSPTWNGGKVIVECSICGKNMERWPSQASDNVVCSQECFAKQHSETVGGENSPHWIDGVKQDYGYDWKHIREEVIKRDNEECFNCGIGRERHIDKYGKDISVHHIEPLRDFDDVDEANQKGNLVTLCASCHQKVEGDVLHISKSDISTFM